MKKLLVCLILFSLVAVQFSAVVDTGAMTCVCICEGCFCCEGEMDCSRPDDYAKPPICDCDVYVEIRKSYDYGESLPRCFAVLIAPDGVFVELVSACIYSTSLVDYYIRMNN